MEFFNTVFIVVIASLVLQGWTVPWLARRLDLQARPAEVDALAAAGAAVAGSPPEPAE